MTSEYLKARSLKNLLACAFMCRELTMSERHVKPKFCAKKSSCLSLKPEMTKAYSSRHNSSHL